MNESSGPDFPLPRVISYPNWGTGRWQPEAVARMTGGGNGNGDGMRQKSLIIASAERYQIKKRESLARLGAPRALTRAEQVSKERNGSTSRRLTG